jgi:hypothetical protein
MEEKDLPNDTKYVKDKLEDVKLKDQVEVTQCILQGTPNYTRE